MTRKRTMLVVVAGLAVGLVAALILAGPSLQRSFFYPKPKNLPPAVSKHVEQLLARLQVAIETNAPAVAQALQSGLSESQISALEAAGRVSAFERSEGLLQVAQRDGHKHDAGSASRPEVSAP